MQSKRKNSLQPNLERVAENTALSPRVEVYQDINGDETDNTNQSDIDIDMEMDADVDFHYYDQFSHFSNNSNNLKFFSEPLSSRSNSNDPPLGLTRSVGVLNLSLETEKPDLKDNNLNDGTQFHIDSRVPQLQKPLMTNSTSSSASNGLKRTMSKTGFSITSPFSKNNASYFKSWNSTNTATTNDLTTSKTTGVSDHSFTEAKPDPAAFQSSGLVSKMKQTIMPKKLLIPDTPVKKSPLVSRHSDHELLDTPILEHSSIMSVQNQTTFPTMYDSQLFKSPPIINTVPPSSDNSPTSSSNPRSKKRTKIVKNTELTSILRQITDDLYGHDQESSIFSPSPTKNNLQTPTKTSFDIPDSPVFMTKLRNDPTMLQQPQKSRSINASVMKNPDFHLTTKFSNVSILGKGQFSTVYQVTFPETGLKYAIKSVRPTKHNFTNRILQEINMLSTIQDSVTNDTEGKEYIIEFISSWSHKGSFYIMTELCENGNLDAFIQEHVVAKQQRLEDWRVWKIIVELCLALRFIHESCSIAHLDLKPANVLITFEGNLKLGDFGMATKLPIQDESCENEGDREYIAPEIIRDGVYDFRADIFSLGLMMIEVAANVVLPDNGSAWHKLRSGDLSDAGRLSSTEIHSSSLFSNKKDHTNITDITSHDTKIPAWVPKFLLDGLSLERIIRWMIEPDYRNRPSASDLLQTEELEYVELTRKTGAVIHEDDYGPKPEFFF
ncbi:unnamed protein product [Kluyveromyces dobzhanskii CBS 2104]|uniref:WGS project CCBQ000000000 data, contig 00041 n=1 Tax=Kluyveromyces dobzhanskii CBS 2104 TaxID=1427455 RepID=A0A0A8L046_9SACH|nr:unnamed protein product [Kluyveromyces dobzhanskii CBS 2104]